MVSCISCISCVSCICLNPVSLVLVIVIVLVLVLVLAFSAGTVDPRVLFFVLVEPHDVEDRLVV